MSAPSLPRSLAAAASALPLLVLGSTGCGALDEFTKTIVDETVIPQSATGLFIPQFSGGGFTGIELSSAQEFENAGVSPSDVDAIWIESIRLDLATGANNPAFDQLDNFIEQVEFFVEAPGQPRVVVAKKEMMPATATTQLDITPGDMLPGVNLKPYAVAESMTFGANMTLKANRGLSATVTTTVVLKVDINLLGT
jgi:hypothetical protein